MPSTSILYEDLNYNDPEVKALLRQRRADMPFANDDSVLDLRRVMEFIARGEVPRQMNGMASVEGYETEFNPQTEVYKVAKKVGALSAAFVDFTDLVVAASELAMRRVSPEDLSPVTFPAMREFLLGQGFAVIEGALVDYQNKFPGSEKTEHFLTAVSNMRYMCKKYGAGLGGDDSPPAGPARGR